MKKWRCTICGYIYVGENPPEICPECGVTSELFELVEDDTSKDVLPVEQEKLQKALLSIPCGLFVIGSVNADGTRVNAMINNTLLQVTSSPLQVILGMDKQHLTTELVRESHVFSATMLVPEQLPLVKTFGFSSGRDHDKFSGIDWHRDATGSPLLKEYAGYFEGRVNPSKTMDAGTHWVFLAEVVKGELHEGRQILTYQTYRNHKQEF